MPPRATHTRPGRVAASPQDPRVELLALLDEESARIEARRQDLGRLHELAATLDTPGPGGSAGVIEVLPPDRAARTVSQLLRDCTGMMRTLVQILDKGPAFDDEAVRGAQDRILSGFVHRTIYPARALDLPTSLQWVRSWASVGEEQRLVPTTATEFAVFGTEAVVMSAQWGNLESGYVVSRHPLVIDVHIAYFDELWAHGQPMSLALGERKDDDHLLELLALGLKDEAIARLLDLGLRTVRRRIARLMAVHGADTRYQLGLAIGQGRRPER